MIIIKYMLPCCTLNQIPWEERICSNQMVKNEFLTKSILHFYIKEIFLKRSAFCLCQTCRSEACVCILCVCICFNKCVQGFTCLKFEHHTFNLYYMSGAWMFLV